MGRITKFFVVLGAGAAIAGAFLPLSSSATAAIDKAVEKTGLSGLFAGITGSLWDVSKMGGSQAAIVWGILGCLGLSFLFGLIGVFGRYGRGLGFGTALTAAGPAFLMVFAMTQTQNFGGAGTGLYLLLSGGVIAFAGGFLALLAPEHRPI